MATIGAAWADSVWNLPTWGINVWDPNKRQIPLVPLERTHSIFETLRIQRILKELRVQSILEQLRVQYINKDK